LNWNTNPVQANIVCWGFSSGQSFNTNSTASSHLIHLTNEENTSSGRNVGLYIDNNYTV
jgi:hypothetical protein